MKIKVSVLGLVAFVLATQCSFAQGYQINLQSNYNKGLAYLTYYQGKNLVLQDSAFVNKTGLAKFAGKQNLPAGIYSVVFPGKRLSADFLIEKEQKISIVADSSKLDKIQITGSPANVIFRDYQIFVASKGKQMSDVTQLRIIKNQSGF
jgi:hypothetical protein